jgi:hypothetical protein
MRSRAKRTCRTTDRVPVERPAGDGPQFSGANRCASRWSRRAPRNVSSLATRSSRTPQATRRTESCGPAFSIGTDAFRRRLMGRLAARAARFGPASPLCATADAAPDASPDANVATVRVAQCAQFSQRPRECQQRSASAGCASGSGTPALGSPVKWPSHPKSQITMTLQVTTLVSRRSLIFRPYESMILLEGGTSSSACRFS